MTDRYTTSHLIEDQYEPGSDGKVLRNLLGITSQEEMEIAETAELWLVQEKLIGEVTLSRGLCGFRRRADRFLLRDETPAFRVALDPNVLDGR